MWHLFLVFTDQIFGITRCFPIQIIYYSDSTTGWFCVRIRFRSYGFTSLDLWYVEDEDYFGDVTWHLFLILGSNFWHRWTMFLDSHYFYLDYILWMLHIFSRLFFEEFRCIMIRELEMFFRLFEAEVFLLLDLLLAHGDLLLRVIMTGLKIWILSFLLHWLCFEAEDLHFRDSWPVSDFTDTSEFQRHFSIWFSLCFILLPYLLVGLLYYSLV